MDNQGSTTLNSTDIKNQEFKKVMRGYDPRAVAEFLDQVATHLDNVHRNEKRLTKELESANRHLLQWESRQDEVTAMKEAAAKEANAIREEASKEAARMIQEVEEKASEIRKNTEEWLAKLISGLEETQRRKESFIKAFKASLDSHYELLEADQAHAESLDSQLSTLLQQQMGASLSH